MAAEESSTGIPENKRTGHEPAGASFIHAARPLETEPWWRPWYLTAVMDRVR